MIEVQQGEEACVIDGEALMQAGVICMQIGSLLVIRENGRRVWMARLI